MLAQFSEKVVKWQVKNAFNRSVLALNTFRQGFFSLLFPLFGKEALISLALLHIQQFPPNKPGNRTGTGIRTVMAPARYVSASAEAISKVISPSYNR